MTSWLMTAAITIGTLAGTGIISEHETITAMAVVIAVSALEYFTRDWRGTDGD